MIIVLIYRGAWIGIPLGVISAIISIQWEKAEHAAHAPHGEH